MCRWKLRCPRPCLSCVHCDQVALQVLAHVEPSSGCSSNARVLLLQGAAMIVFSALGLKAMGPCFQASHLSMHGEKGGSAHGSLQRLLAHLRASQGGH